MYGHYALHIDEQNPNLLAEREYAAMSTLMTCDSKSKALQTRRKLAHVWPHDGCSEGSDISVCGQAAEASPRSVHRTVQKPRQLLVRRNGLKLEGSRNLWRDQKGSSIRVEHGRGWETTVTSESRDGTPRKWIGYTVYGITR
ncbi:hypothetical protein AcV5_009994 [Taiwanofungus camphoratus]|nr:hypothetical protein AcV5_009994 [Antrodia cinnamomea]